MTNKKKMIADKKAELAWALEKRVQVEVNSVKQERELLEAKIGKCDESISQKVARQKALKQGKIAKEYLISVQWQERIFRASCFR